MRLFQIRVLWRIRIWVWGSRGIFGFAAFGWARFGSVSARFYV